MENKLYLHDNYTDFDVESLFSTELIEYDMKAAGYNITKYFKLLPESTFIELDKLPKYQRNVRLGLIQEKDQEYKKALKQGFKDARQLFFEANNLEANDILSIKKDAIFTKRKCKYTEFDNLKFVAKNTYSSYMNIEKLQLFYNGKDIHVKGINDEKVKLHEQGILQYLKDVFNYNETMNHNFIIKFIKEFSMEYKSRELPVEFYREFNKRSYYKLNETLNDLDLWISEASEMQLDQEKELSINIEYNYEHVIIPTMLMQL